jgi:hypothetical protein
VQRKIKKCALHRAIANPPKTRAQAQQAGMQQRNRWLQAKKEIRSLI